MGGLGGVEVREDSVATGEVEGGRESPREDVFFEDFGGVKKGGEALAIQQNNDLRVRRDQRPRWHVDSENG